MPKNQKPIPHSFKAEITDLEEVNPLFSKGRVKIFYRGENRNSTFFSKEVAEEMLTYLPYTPVVGEWDEEKQDFTEHTNKTRPYGVVLANDNITWETVTEEDGEEVLYACADVYLWTGRYPEAKKIIGKGQSMELDPSSIEGEWGFVGRREVFKFTKARISALTVLGDDVEPCFESAGFFSAKEARDFKTEFTSMLEELKISLEEGGQKMPDFKEIKFKLSHEEIRDKLWELLNSPDDDGYYTYEYSIQKVYDDCVIAHCWSDDKNYRIYYAKDGDNVSLTGEKVEVFFVEVTQEEKDFLELLKIERGGYKAAYDEYAAQVAEKESALAEKDTVIAAKDEEIANFQAQLVEKDEHITSLGAELEVLKDFKKQAETKEKEEVINKFAAALDEETIAEVRKNIDTLTASEIEAQLSIQFARVRLNEIIEEKQKSSGVQKVFSSVTAAESLSGWEKIVKSHKNEEVK